MTDDTARVARLMKVVEALVAELNRQGLAEIVADRGFDPIEWPYKPQPVPAA